MTSQTASNRYTGHKLNETCLVCCNNLNIYPLEPEGESPCTICKQECSSNPTHLSRYLCLEHGSHFKNLTIAKKHVRNAKKRITQQSATVEESNHRQNKEEIIVDESDPSFPLQSQEAFMNEGSTSMEELNDFLRDKLNDQGLRQ